MPAAPPASCRICRSHRACEVGTVEYLAGFPRTVFDCADCGCRFTAHSAAIFQQLHASPAISYYVTYRDLAAKCQRLFNSRDTAGLKQLLSESPKYAFIIEAIEREPAAARLLELGCSRGYLTSYFILGGRTILGVDVSPDAIAAARQAFGDHFVVAGTAAAENAGPFDVIYHVGTIGCVADPIGFTRSLLSRLRPGGRLLFNAPNRDGLYYDGQLWIDSAPPPEMVTLFPSGFFARQFSGVADVRETVHHVSPQTSFGIGLRRRLGQRWVAPVPKPVSGFDGQSWEQPRGAYDLIERVAGKIARLTGLEAMAKPRPFEFGLHLEMIKKPS